MPGAEEVIDVGEPVVREDGELEVLDAAALRFARKRDMAIGLIHRIQVQGLSYAEAWRQVNAPKKLTGSDKTHQEQANRLLKWFREHCPPDYEDSLDMANVGIHAIEEDLMLMRKATKYCPHTKRQIPDWKARGDALRIMASINPTIIRVKRAAVVKAAAGVDPDGKHAEEVSAIVTGEKFATKEEWKAYMQQINEQEAARQAKEAMREQQQAGHAITAGDEAADGAPLTAEELV